MSGKLSTIWIATFMLVALLSSSITISAPLMLPHIPVDSYTTRVTEHHDAHCLPLEHIDESGLQKCCDAEKMAAELRCCTGGNVTSYAIISGFVPIYQPTYNRNHIPRQPVAHSRTLANPPFRPPIA